MTQPWMISRCVTEHQLTLQFRETKLRNCEHRICFTVFPEIVPPLAAYWKLSPRHHVCLVCHGVWEHTAMNLTWTGRHKQLTTKGRGAPFAFRDNNLQDTNKTHLRRWEMQATAKAKQHPFNNEIFTDFTWIWELAPLSLTDGKWTLCPLSCTQG